MAAGRATLQPMEEGTEATGIAHLGSGLLIFDGDCGFCTWAAEWSERRLPPDARISPWQFLQWPSYGLTTKSASSAVYWIDPEGRPHRGHHAIARTLRVIGGVWEPLGVIMEAPVLTWLAAGLF